MRTGIHIENKATVTKAAVETITAGITRVLKAAHDNRSDREVTLKALDVLAGGVRVDPHNIIMNSSVTGSTDHSGAATSDDDGSDY
jgi:hypothetical protein